MKRLTSWLDKGPLLTDGAWGTQLHLKGLEPGACPDAWNVTNPEAVAEVARSYEMCIRDSSLTVAAQ